MRILASEDEKQEASADDVQVLLIEEARRVWELHQEDYVREIYFRAEKTSAVLMLVCSDMEEARRRLSKLPLVLANLVDFELIPLVPYPGFSRLFES